MNYLYLRAFHTVATERSFTRAARILRVGQPTLSWQVKALEEFYGVRLFHRRGTNVVATEVGQQVLEKTREIYKIQDEIEAILDRFQTLKTGSLKVGADGPRHIMPVVHRFGERYPEIGVSLTTGNARKVLDDLLKYETDVAIVAMQKSQDSRLFMVPFYTYRLVAFVTRTHQWARRRSIPLQAFAGERIIVRAPSSLTRQVLMRALNKAKVQPTALIEIDNREAGRDAVALGMGVGVMSDTEFPDEDRFTVAVEIDAPEMQLTEYIACLKGRAQTRIIRTFFEIASDMAPKTRRIRRR